MYGGEIKTWRDISDRLYTTSYPETTGEVHAQLYWEHAIESSSRKCILRTELKKVVSRGRVLYSYRK